VAERIQKILANYGVGSRRAIEQWIEQGRIFVNGRPAKLGEALSGKESVRIDGRKINLQRSRQQKSEQFIAYYKPTGEVCTRNDPEGRSTVFEAIKDPYQKRWVSVGRLDINTSGLLLLTTNGELAHRLMHPSYGIQREYSVRLLGKLSDANRNSLKRGVRLEEGIARFHDITYSGGSGKNQWYRVSLRGGRYREIRRVFKALDFQVSRLIRIRYGPILLGDLRRGGSRRLTPKEIQILHESVDLRAH